MPEATGSGITKVNVRQASAAPWKIHPTTTTGVSYTQAQVLTWVQAATDRNNA